MTPDLSQRSICRPGSNQSGTHKEKGVPVSEHNGRLQIFIKTITGCHLLYQTLNRTTVPSFVFNRRTTRLQESKPFSVNGEDGRSMDEL